MAEANPKSKHLEPLATGAAKGAVALLEPDTGWNPSEVQLKASPDGKGFKLSGRKSYVLDAGVADVIVCVARTPDGPALLAVPAKAPGVKVSAVTPLDATRK